MAKELYELQKMEEISLGMGDSEKDGDESGNI